MHVDSAAGVFGTFALTIFDPKNALKEISPTLCSLQLLGWEIFREVSIWVNFCLSRL
jgi:hypothetical protein